MTFYYYVILYSNKTSITYYIKLHSFYFYSKAYKNNLFIKLQVFLLPRARSFTLLYLRRVYTIILVTLPRVELGTPPWKGDDLTDCPKRHIKRRADCSNYRHNFLQSKIFSNSALARRPILRIGTPLGYLPQEEESNPSQSIIFYSTADFSSLCFIRRYLPNLEMRLHRSLFLATRMGFEPTTSSVTG